LLGVPQANNVVGPNLTNVALRPTLAGETIPNTPENMRQWIVDPPAMKNGATMPKLNVSENDARDLTAFLYSQAYNPVR
jgi:cytochrome c1